MTNLNLTNNTNLNAEDIENIRNILKKPYEKRIKNELEYRACVSRLEKNSVEGIDENTAIGLRKDFYNQSYRYIPKTTLYL